MFEKTLLTQVISRLQKIGLITHTLSIANAMFLGVVQLYNNAHRRLDIIYLPVEEVGSAQLYFTGNAFFNRSMRSLADTKGMKLTRRGLYVRSDIGDDPSMGRVTGCETERGIFAALGVPYQLPEQRNP